MKCEITYSEFLGWVEFLEWDERRTTKECLYFAQMAAEIRRSYLVPKDAQKIKLDDFILKFSDRKKASSEPISEEERKGRVQKSKRAWAGALGVDLSKKKAK